MGFVACRQPASLTEFLAHQDEMSDYVGGNGSQYEDCDGLWGI